MGNYLLARIFDSRLREDPEGPTSLCRCIGGRMEEERKSPRSRSTGVVSSRHYPL